MGTPNLEGGVDLTRPQVPQDIQAIIDALRTSALYPSSRPRSLVTTKLEEALFWAQHDHQLAAMAEAQG